MDVRRVMACLAAGRPASRSVATENYKCSNVATGGGFLSEDATRTRECGASNAPSAAGGSHRRPVVHAIAVRRIQNHAAPLPYRRRTSI